MPFSRRRFLEATAAGVIPPVAGLTSSGRAGGQLPEESFEKLRKRNEGETVLTVVGDFFLMREFPDHEEAEAEQVFDLLRESDLAFANLENGLSTVGSPDASGFPSVDWGGGLRGPSLRGHPSLVKELTWAGVNAVSLANNHTGNYGRDALLETLTTLDGAGIRYAGAGRNVEEAFAPAYLRAGGLTVAFLSLYSYYYQYGADEVASATEAGVASSRAFDVLLQVPSGLESGYVNPRRDNPPYQLGLQTGGSQAVLAPLKEDIDRMRDAISQAQARADFTILSVHLHWGRSGKHDLPFQQRVLVQAAIDAGVDLFVGHGPHVLGGVETFSGKAIAYSIGNFVLSPASAPEQRGKLSLAALVGGQPTRQSVVLRATVKRKEVVALELLPIVIGADGRPRFARGADGQRIVQKLIGLSAQLGTEIEETDWFGNVRV